MVVGSIGSGKSWATNFLSKVYSYKALNSGRVLASLLDLPPVPKTPRAEFQSAAWEFITSQGGPRRLAEELIKKVNQSRADYVVIDGIRQVETLFELQEISTQPIAVLFVHASPDVAYDLFKGREAKGSEKDVDQLTFMKLYSAPVEQGVKYLMNSADIVMYNWLGADKYDAALSAMATELGLRRAE